MNSIVFRNIVRFVFLVILQVLVFNNIQVFSFITPFIYILFIIQLPFETPKWFRLILGFLLGLIIDIFSNSEGIHAASTLLIAYIIPWVQNLVSSKQDNESVVEPAISSLGFNGFFFYSLILTGTHHIFLFYLEIFKLSDFFFTLWHTILNIVFTMIFIICIQYIFYRKK